VKPPKGLITKFDRVEDGKVWFKIKASKFYLFKTILKIAKENRSILIFLFAFYYLVRK